MSTTLPPNAPRRLADACRRFEEDVRAALDKTRLGRGPRPSLVVSVNYGDMPRSRSGGSRHSYQLAENVSLIFPTALSGTSNEERDYALSMLRARLAPCVQIAVETIIGSAVSCISIEVSTSPDAPDSIGRAPHPHQEANDGDPETRSASDSNTIFVPTKPRYRLDQVVLSEAMHRDIQEAVGILRCREVIYETWGFREIDPEPKAVLNFYGPPGTGKTMCAHAIAHHLGMPIMCLNYSDVESKFVGDAPKNLARAFGAARSSGALLFFDEADSFLGKRITSVSSSSDQAVNSLRSQMLILLEQFEGVVIFATNLVTNYDKGFETRILRHLKFELPSMVAREMIIRKTIPTRVPLHTHDELSDSRVSELSLLADGFSGRDIKLAVLKALSAAAFREQKSLGFADFRDAFAAHRSEREQLGVAGLSARAAPEKAAALSADAKAAVEAKISRELDNPTRMPPAL